MYIHLHKTCLISLSLHLTSTTAPAPPSTDFQQSTVSCLNHLLSFQSGSPTRLKRPLSLVILEVERIPLHASPGFATVNHIPL